MPHRPHGIGGHLHADRPGLKKINDAQGTTTTLVEHLDLPMVVLLDVHGRLPREVSLQPVELPS